MKRGRKFPWPKRGITARTIHVQGPISAMRDLISVQQNEKARKWLRKWLLDFRASAGFEMARPDILYWMKECARDCKVHVPKGTLL